MFRASSVALTLTVLITGVAGGFILSNRVNAQAPPPARAAALVDNDRITVRRATQPAGTIEKPHTHPEADYLSIQLTPGDLEVTVGGETTKGTPGMAWWLPKGTTHTMNNVGKTNVDVIVVTVK